MKDQSFVFFYFM